LTSGKVYDVTPFMDDHPGGGEIMLSAAGKDGTQARADTVHVFCSQAPVVTAQCGPCNQSDTWEGVRSKTPVDDSRYGSRSQSDTRE
jgi:hypothetical protein